LIPSWEAPFENNGFVGSNLKEADLSGERCLKTNEGAQKKQGKVIKSHGNGVSLVVGKYIQVE